MPHSLPACSPIDTHPRSESLAMDPVGRRRTAARGLLPFSECPPHLPPLQLAPKKTTATKKAAAPKPKAATSKAKAAAAPKAAAKAVRDALSGRMQGRVGLLRAWRCSHEFGASPNPPAQPLTPCLRPYPVPALPLRRPPPPRSRLPRAPPSAPPPSPPPRASPPARRSEEGRHRQPSCHLDGPAALLHLAGRQQAAVAPAERHTASCNLLAK